MNENHKDLSDLIPIDELIDHLEFEFAAESILRAKSVLQRKEAISVLIYLKRYKNSLKKKTRKKK